MRFPRREAEPAREAADDQTVWFGPPGFGDRSCCCPARPVVRVLIPESSVRPHFCWSLLVPAPLPGLPGRPGRRQRCGHRRGRLGSASAVNERWNRRPRARRRRIAGM